MAPHTRGAAPAARETGKTESETEGFDFGMYCQFGPFFFKHARHRRQRQPAISYYTVLVYVKRSCLAY